MERRRFIQNASLLGLGGLAGCAKTHRYTAQNLPLNEGKDGFLMKVGDLKENTSTLVYSKTGPVLLVKSNGRVKAYESLCPHTMCEVNDGEREQPIINGEIRCWIHDSFFNPSDGSYISGPAIPGSKLPDFRIKILEGKIYRDQDKSTMTNMMPKF